MYKLLLWFTRGTVGRRLRYIVNDRGLWCFEIFFTFFLLVFLTKINKIFLSLACFAFVDEATTR